MTPGYLLDPCEICGRERSEHSEMEAIACIVRGLRDDGVRVVVPPGEVVP